MWAAFWLSCGVVFVAELGDKSQLIALTFATRYRPVLVMTGIAVATALINGGIRQQSRGGVHGRDGIPAGRGGRQDHAGDDHAGVAERLARNLGSA
ncbi:MAG TPA: TMEM165/GDT1 family protein [Jiangellaceae bacterium]|nr:TMEM165/GDT1 family protein [Jiangellaceae bacterium]